MVGRRRESRYLEWIIVKIKLSSTQRTRQKNTMTNDLRRWATTGHFIGTVLVPSHLFFPLYNLLFFVEAPSPFPRKSVHGIP